MRTTIPVFQENGLFFAVAIEIEALVILGLFKNNKQQVLDALTIRVAERPSLFQNLFFQQFIQLV